MGKNTVNICEGAEDAMLIVETAGLSSALPLLFVFLVLTVDDLFSNIHCKIYFHQHKNGC